MRSLLVCASCALFGLVTSSASAQSFFNTVKQEVRIAEISTVHFVPDSLTYADYEYFDEDEEDYERDEDDYGDCIPEDPYLSQTMAEASAMELFMSVAWPLKTVQVSSPFGRRQNPFKAGSWEFHKGLDLKARYTEAYAMMPGVVEKVGHDRRSGNYITIRHGDYTVSYCHLSEMYCTKGSEVVPGMVIGITGNTGRSTGPHLHLTVKYRNRPIDPSFVLDYIKGIREEALDEIASIRSYRRGVEPVNAASLDEEAGAFPDVDDLGIGGDE